MADALKKEEFDRLRGELETSSDSLSGYVSEALYFLKNASVFPTWNTLRGSARIDPMNSSRYPTSDIAVELLRDYVYRLYVGERVQDEINAPARGSKPKWNGQERLNHLIYADYPDLDALNRYAALGQTSGDSQNSAYHQLTSGPDGPGKALAKTNVGLIGRPKAGADSSQKGVVAANAPTKMLMTENQFLNAIGAGEIAQQVSDQTAVELVSVGNIMETLQMSHDFLETFVLPGLFGVLGTIVFECRRMLDSLRPMDSPWILLVRGALGGLAGLSVALVIRPLESGSNASTFAGLAGFAVAFLFGFSIDVFFAMIERLVSSLVQTVSGENKARTTSV